MAEKKITKRENFEGIKAFLVEHGKTEWANVMAHEIDLLARKSSKSATPTASDKDNMAIAEIVKDILVGVEGNGMTVGELLQAEPIKAYVCHDGKAVSSQRMTAIFTKYSKDFVRTVVKKVPYFTLAYGVEGEGEGD